MGSVGSALSLGGHIHDPTWGLLPLPPPGDGLRRIWSLHEENLVTPRGEVLSRGEQAPEEALWCWGRTAGPCWKQSPMRVDLLAFRKKCVMRVG